MYTESPAKPLEKLAAQDMTCDLDLSADELDYVLELTAQVKKAPQDYARSLAGRYLALLFEKPSLRTRLTFELAIKQLGGDSVLSEGMIGDREPLKDVARNLERWTSGIVARTYSQKTITELAQWAGVPVINALSDLFHPCQALADVFTLQERFGKLRGLKLTFIGDGNNVAHSLMLTAIRLGIDFTLATPPEYGPDPEITAQAEGLATASGSNLRILHDPEEAVAGAQAVYTDVWASMGHEHEAERRHKAFQSYQVNADLFSLASANAVFMHCLPAKRGMEVTDSIMECPSSVVFDQAENRLHTQKALLLKLLG